MYERFTDRARKVYQLANAWAQSLNHEYIGAEHILMGLLREGGGIGVHALKNLGIDRDELIAQLENTISPGGAPEQVVVGKLPHAPNAKKVKEFAIEQARILGHMSVGTGDILLGLMCVNNTSMTVPYRLLVVDRGLTIKNVCDEIAIITGSAPTNKEVELIDGFKVLATVKADKLDWHLEGGEPIVPNSEKSTVRYIAYKPFTATHPRQCVESKGRTLREQMKTWMAEWWGDRCPEVEPTCSLCQAWHAFDYMFANVDASCGDPHCPMPGCRQEADDPKIIEPGANLSAS